MYVSKDNNIVIMMKKQNVKILKYIIYFHIHQYLHQKLMNQYYFIRIDNKRVQIQKLEYNNNKKKKIIYNQKNMMKMKKYVQQNLEKGLEDKHLENRKKQKKSIIYKIIKVKVWKVRKNYYKI